jgi:hypothetical protein
MGADAWGPPSAAPALLTRGPAPPSGRGRDGPAGSAGPYRDPHGEVAMSLEFAPGKTRVGWIGTGVMGSSMCGHLMAAGYAVTAFNRSREKLRPLVERGAGEADSPREVAEAADVVFTIVGYPRDVREVTLGPDGTLAGARPGRRAGGHDDQRAGPGARDLRGGRGPGRPRRRRAGLRRGRRGARGPAVDHGRGRGRGRRRAGAPVCRSWARRSCTRGRPGRGSIPRWSTRS